MRIVKYALVILFVINVSVLHCQQRPDAVILAELQRRVGPAPGITITVQNGVVTLTGTASSLAQRLNIVNMSRRTVGVREVNDRLTVVPARPRPDAEIASAIRAALAENLSPAEVVAITVSVQNAVVTLTGTLPSSYPRELAGTLASLNPSVVDVRNNITVEPPQRRPDATLLADVNARFTRNPMIPHERINVSVSNGVVTLTGVVDSFVQVEQAGSVARFTPGVIDVRNDLFVSG